MKCPPRRLMACPVVHRACPVVSLIEGWVNHEVTAFINAIIHGRIHIWVWDLLGENESCEVHLRRLYLVLRPSPFQTLSLPWWLWGKCLSFHLTIFFCDILSCHSTKSNVACWPNDNKLHMDHYKTLFQISSEILPAIQGDEATGNKGRPHDYWQNRSWMMPDTGI